MVLSGGNIEISEYSACCDRESQSILLGIKEVRIGLISVGIVIIEGDIADRTDIHRERIGYAKYIHRRFGCHRIGTESVGSHLNNVHHLTLIVIGFVIETDIF